MAAGKGAVQTMEERFDYGLNPKSWEPVLIPLRSGHGSRWVSAGKEPVPGGNRPGRRAWSPVFSNPAGVPARRSDSGGGQPELAMKQPCAGRRESISFFVCTHTDKGHLHNHIYFNSTAFDRSRKFHNFIGSSFALRRLSDRVCIGAWPLRDPKSKTAQQRAGISIMVSGLGKSRHLQNSGCGWPSWRLCKNSPPIFRRFWGLWRSPAFW